MNSTLTVGVLALQGGFSEHLVSLQKASKHTFTFTSKPTPRFNFVEVRTPEQLDRCDALVIPGGESTTLSLVAAQSGLLDPLRDYVKKKPTWGTCAGLILLSLEASATKRGGQELIGGLDVRVHRNHFGRQRESFIMDLELDFLDSLSETGEENGEARRPFPGVFIRAPVVDKVLASADGSSEEVKILATLPGRHASNKKAELNGGGAVPKDGDGDIVALRQGNVFGTSFHPELTEDVRIHRWWLDRVVEAVARA